jgi:hypothetical protein
MLTRRDGADDMIKCACWDEIVLRHPGGLPVGRIGLPKSAKTDQLDGVMKAPCAIRPEMPPIMS